MFTRITNTGPCIEGRESDGRGGVEVSRISGPVSGWWSSRPEGPGTRRLTATGKGKEVRWVGEGTRTRPGLLSSLISQRL